MKHVPLTPGLAFITILKGMIGTGILGLPYVCGQVRLGIAAPGMIAAATIGAFSVWRLIQCKALVFARQFPWDESTETEDSLSSIDEHNFGLGPLATVGERCFGTFGVVLAGFGIIVSQLGFAVSYIHVIVSTLSESSLLGSSLTTMQLHFAVGIFLCALSLLRELRSLAWLSGAALCIYGYLLVALIAYGGQELSKNGDSISSTDLWWPIQWQHFGTFFGTCIFAQEAIVVSQYVYDEMRLNDPKSFLPVLLTTFSVSGLLFSFVGAFGFISYGSSIKHVFYLNFPPGGAVVVVGEVVLCLVLLLSYGLQMYPVMTFLEATILQESDRSDSSNNDDNSGSEKRKHWHNGIMRCVAVSMTCIASWSVPNLSCITGYSGCFAMSTIGFFMPALCHAKLHGWRLSPSQWLGDLLLLATGVAAVGFGLFSTSC